MKKYLLSINSGVGAEMHIAAQTDSTKPIVVYYCGRDTGKRYVSIGAAANYLKKVLAVWKANTDTTRAEYGTADEIPVFGCSEWNKELFKYQYCKKPFPNVRKYYHY